MARRLLLLDTSDPDRPVWLIAQIPDRATFAAAVDDAGQYQFWPAVTDVVRDRLGDRDIGLTPVQPPLKAWTIGSPQNGAST